MWQNIVKCGKLGEGDKMGKAAGIMRLIFYDCGNCKNLVHLGRNRLDLPARVHLAD